MWVVVPAGGFGTVVTISVGLHLDYALENMAVLVLLLLHQTRK